MWTFFAIIGVILLITFREEVFSFLKNIFVKVTPVLKDTAGNVSSSVKTFVEGMNEEITKKTLFGKYVVSPVKIVEIGYRARGVYYDSVEDIDTVYNIVFTFDNGRKFSFYVCAVSEIDWQLLAVGDTCSHVQKFNRKGQLTFEEYLPVPPENVCYSAFGQPYHRNYHSC